MNRMKKIIMGVLAFAFGFWLGSALIDQIKIMVGDYKENIEVKVQVNESGQPQQQYSPDQVAELLMKEFDLSPEEFKDRLQLCNTKAFITQSIMQQRDEISLEEQLQMLEDQKYRLKELKLWSHASYVDLQRAIRDVYRMNRKGVYRLDPNDEEQMKIWNGRSSLNCMAFGY